MSLYYTRGRQRIRLHHSKNVTRAAQDGALGFILFGHTWRLEQNEYHRVNVERRNIQWLTEDGLWRNCLAIA